MSSFVSPFAAAIEEGSEIITQYIRSNVSTSSNQLTQPPEFPQFESCISSLIGQVNAIENDSALPASALDEIEDETSKESARNDLEKFNNGLQERTRDYVLLLIFQHAAQGLITEYVKSFTSEGAGEPDERVSLNSLSLTIDIAIELYLHHLPSTKNIIYQVISLISDSLFNISTSSVEKFWCYLESRQHIFQARIFDQKLTSDRISLLEICNGLTDKFYNNTPKDSYKKDSFNDKFQFRVRVFLTNVFQFEDNTGLNKYFTTAKRASRESAPLKASSWEDELLQDIVQFNKIVRDPYSLLKPNNSRAISNCGEIINRLMDFLFEEEEARASKNPKVEPFVVDKTPRTNDDEEYFKQKYENKRYFPESYWLTPFEEKQRGDSYDLLRRQDEDYFLKELDQSKLRNVLLVEIYFVCCLFYQLVGSNKKQLLKEIKAPATVKHITDESIPESLVSLFFKLRKDIIRRYKTVDSQLSFLLQHLQSSELHWWGFLIYGKDPSTGKPLFSDRVLSQEELESVAQKSTNVIPYKEKRYFNVYGTPQLSRKMKVATGIDLLKKSGESHDSSIGQQSKIDALSSQIESSGDKKQIEELVEERTCLQWRQLKGQRNGRWLEFGSLLESDMLTAKEPSQDVGEEKVEKSTQADEKKRPLEDNDSSEMQDIKENSTQDDENPKKRPLEEENPKKRSLEEENPKKRPLEEENPKKRSLEEESTPAAESHDGADAHEQPAEEHIAKKAKTSGPTEAEPST